MLNLNSYQMPTTCHKTGASLCSPNHKRVDKKSAGFAMSQRVARLKYECRKNTAKQITFTGGK